MSKEQTKNEEVLLEEEAIEMVELEEDKKAKVIKLAKKGLKIAGIVGLAVLGVVVVSTICGKSDINNSDVIDVVNDEIK